MATRKRNLLLTVFGGGILLGILLWGGLHTVIEQTNSLWFCTSCHEMERVYLEYQQSTHFKNAAGVRAICSDCHVPRDWMPMMIRKLRATNELYHKLMGSIDSDEKFEAKRLEMAERVWKTMRETDSRECRNCHAWEYMDFHKQGRRSVEKMQPVVEDKTGETCIDCHKGIAHKLPDDYERDDD